MQKPLLALNAQGSAFLTENESLFNKAATNATWLQVQGADHMTFGDAAWGPELPWGRAPALAINVCLVWFFDTHLKGQAPPFPKNLELINVRTK